MIEIKGNKTEQLTILWLSYFHLMQKIGLLANEAILIKEQIKILEGETECRN